MKNQLTKTLPFFLLSFAFACGDDGTGEPEFLSPGETLAGAWLLTEYGYSPGAGYYTEPIPREPAQTISFNANGSMSSNAEGFTEYNYYVVLEDPRFPGHKIVALFTTNPEGQSLDIEKLSPTYNITFTETMLKLSYRWCVEGCHVGMKRLPPANHVMSKM